jgi:hypothetical protein
VNIDIQSSTLTLAIIIINRIINLCFRIFEERATGVLDECFEENETLSQTLLVRELDNYGYLTCLDLAVSGDSQDFIAHTACQLLLTRLWMGAMAMNTTSFKVNKVGALDWNSCE